MDAPTKIDLAEYYYGFLKNLSRESKLDLIIRLAQSLKEDNSDDTSPEADQSLFEAAQSEQIAEDVMVELRALRKEVISKTGGSSNVF
jgi:hypothetical protein